MIINLQGFWRFGPVLQCFKVGPQTVLDLFKETICRTDSDSIGLFLKLGP